MPASRRIPSARGARALLAGVVLAAALVVPGGASAAPASTVLTIATPSAPQTPRRLDRVQVRRYGPADARAVLVLVPGTFGGAADFHVLAPALVKRVPGLQVWAQMRREGALQDTRVLERARAARVTPQAAFDHYLGWLANGSISPHYQPLDRDDYGFVKQWGLAVAMEDLHAVVRRARGSGRAQRTVILGGHSLGGWVAAMYAAWDFDGRAGVRDLAGIVSIDGGPSPSQDATLRSAAQARAQLARLDRDGPFADLLGLGIPWIAGAFGQLSALAAHVDPEGVSIGQRFPLLPPLFRAPVSVTNRAQLGYAFDASTSPPALSLIQIRSGGLAASGDPRDWVEDPRLPTPIGNLADAFSLAPLGAIEWYYPARLSLDVGAGSGLRQTPAARALGLRIEHVGEVDVPYYAFAAALSGRDDRLRRGARAFEQRSRIPRVTFVDRSATYSHLDPLLAAPDRSAFVATVVPWLKRALKTPVR